MSFPLSLRLLPRASSLPHHLPRLSLPSPFSRTPAPLSTASLLARSHHSASRLLSQRLGAVDPAASPAPSRLRPLAAVPARAVHAAPGPGPARDEPAEDETPSKKGTPAQNWPRPGHPYGWIDAEAEALIAKAYQRHRALSDSGRAFPPSLGITVSELEALAAPHHYPPQNFVDKACLQSMRFLRRFVHAFFREKYDHHAVCLETVAAIPGIVGAFHRHLRSLRNMQRDHGFINPLLEESENERMHLLIWMQLTQPTRVERGLVLVAQAAYLSFYTALYLLVPRAAHRLVGYLEEEAHAAYTDYLAAIDDGRIVNRPAPKIAVDYYSLSNDATVRDVVLHVRADEAAHREFNHFLAGKYEKGDLDSPPVFMKVDHEQAVDKAERGDFSGTYEAGNADVGDRSAEKKMGDGSK